MAEVAYQGSEYNFPLYFREFITDLLYCSQYFSSISYNAPLCAKRAEKSGFKFIKSGGLSLKTEARVLFSPSEKGTSIHFIFTSGFSASNSPITLFIYGAKSFICNVQKINSSEFDFLYGKVITTNNSVHNINKILPKVFFTITHSII